MIEVAIIFDVERDITAVIGANGHALFADPLNRPERAVLHLQAALVAQEHDAVAGSKVPVAALRRGLFSEQATQACAAI